MRGLVLWLFADLIFRLNNFIETIGFLLSLALIAPRHHFVAGRQHLSFILLPVIESLLFSWCESASSSATCFGLSKCASGFKILFFSSLRKNLEIGALAVF